MHSIVLAGQEVPVAAAAVVFAAAVIDVGVGVVTFMFM